MAGVVVEELTNCRLVVARGSFAWGLSALGLVQPMEGRGGPMGAQAGDSTRHRLSKQVTIKPTNSIRLETQQRGMRAPHLRPAPPVTAAAPRRSPAGTPPALCSPATCPCPHPHPLQAQQRACHHRRRRRSCCCCRCCLRTGWHRCCCWRLRSPAYQPRRRQACCRLGPGRSPRGVRMYEWRTLPARMAPPEECAAAGKVQVVWVRVGTSVVPFLASIPVGKRRPGANTVHSRPYPQTDVGGACHVHCTTAAVTGNPTTVMRYHFDKADPPCTTR